MGPVLERHACFVRRAGAIFIFPFLGGGHVNIMLSCLKMMMRRRRRMTVMMMLMMMMTMTMMKNPSKIHAKIHQKSIKNQSKIMQT